MPLISKQLIEMDCDGSALYEPSVAPCPNTKILSIENFNNNIIASRYQLRAQCSEKSGGEKWQREQYISAEGLGLGIIWMN
jgi:hypothetical protein